MAFTFSGVNINGSLQAAYIPPPNIVLYMQAWGLNSSGQLGLGDITDRSSPVQIGLGYNIISSGSDNNLAIKSNNTLWAWGNGSFGKLGLGNTTTRSSPTQVGALTTWATAACGGSVSMAIKTDGTLWTIGGYNYYGQLGIGAEGVGTFVGISSPQQVGALTDWLRVSSGGYHCLAVKTDNTLWSWGYNSQGTLGVGDTIHKSSPVQVGSGYNSISTGYYHSLAIKTNGTLWSWGANNGSSGGALGLGDTTNRSSPVQVGALTTWSTIATGGYNSAAIKTDGTLWVWGRNYQGPLGLGNTTDYSSPKQVGALTNWLKIAASSYTFGIIKTDGTLWTTGKNDKGQLGDGTTTNRSSPVQVGAQANWSNVSVGTSHILAIG